MYTQGPQNDTTPTAATSSRNVTTQQIQRDATSLSHLPERGQQGQDRHGVRPALAAEAVANPDIVLLQGLLELAVGLALLGGHLQHLHL